MLKVLVLFVGSDSTRRRGVFTASHARDQGSTGRIEETRGHLRGRVPEHAHGLLDDGIIGSEREKASEEESEYEDDREEERGTDREER
jgi:hypothetical protein